MSEPKHQLLKIFMARAVGAWKPKHEWHVVSAVDEIEAAKEAFLTMKPPSLAKADLEKTAHGRKWIQRGAPREFEVWRMMTPAEFRENVGRISLHDDREDSDCTPYEAMSDMFIDKKVIEL